MQDHISIVVVADFGEAGFIQSRNGKKVLFNHSTTRISITTCTRDHTNVYLYKHHHDDHDDHHHHGHCDQSPRSPPCYCRQLRPSLFADCQLHPLPVSTNIIIAIVNTIILSYHIWCSWSSPLSIIWSPSSPSYDHYNHVHHYHHHHHHDIHFSIGSTNSQAQSLDTSIYSKLLGVPRFCLKDINDHWLHG